MDPASGIAGDSEELLAIADEIAETITPENKVLLQELMAYARAPESNINLSSWVNNVELTGNRAGMLLCADFSVALNTLQSRVFSVGKIPGRETARELVLYNISKVYLELRRKLGISLDSETQSEEEA